MRLLHTFESVELNSFRLPFCHQVSGNCQFALHVIIIAGPPRNVKRRSSLPKDVRRLTQAKDWDIMIWPN